MSNIVSTFLPSYVMDLRNRMNRMKGYFAILLLVLCGLWGCKHAPKEMHKVNIEAFRVEPHTIDAVFEFVGVAKSSHPVEIRSRVEGYLFSIDYVEGSCVEKNTLLFQIDPRPFLASLEGAKGALAKQEAVLWRAKKSLARIEPLYKQNAASQRDFDDATAQVLAAEAMVIEAQANLVQAELNLSYTHITSPIKGLTGRALFREGTLITPSVNGLLTEVSIIDPIWVYFSIADNELLRGKAEGTAKTLILPKEHQYSVSLELADGSIFPYEGKVNFASPTLDPQTGTLTVRAEFSNPVGEILPGQFVRAKVKGARYPNALFVPQSAVFQGNRGKCVFLIDAHQSISIKEVVVGDWFKNYWIIKEGLNPGDLVVADGVNKVRENTTVHVLSTQSYDR
jgi:membrane fusion protein, multidrug efflux system